MDPLKQKDSNDALRMIRHLRSVPLTNGMRWENVVHVKYIFLFM